MPFKADCGFICANCQLLFALPSAELKLKLFHPHFSAAELYTFHLQTEALIKTMLAGQSDPAARGHHAMPGEPVRLIQHAHHLAGCARKAGGTGDGAVAGNFAVGDFQNSGTNTRRKRRICLFGFCHLLIVPRDLRECPDRPNRPQNLLAAVVLGNDDLFHNQQFAWNRGKSKTGRIRNCNLFVFL